MLSRPAVNFSGANHAGIWAGTAASFVDLHPASAETSAVAATTGARQAGYAVFGGLSQAAIWSGTAASYVSLHAVLPANYISSAATGISGSGSTLQVVGYAYNATASRSEAILWQLQLPPPTLAPTVTVSGKKRHRTTGKATLVLRGTSTDATRVEIKIGKVKYKPAKGTANWKFKAKLQPGKNKVFVHAVNVTGVTSPVVKVTILRLVPNPL